MQFILVIIGIWATSFILYALIDFIIAAVFIMWCLTLSGVFSKFGEDEWKSFIPFYNIYIIIKASGLQIYYMIGCLLPLFGKIGWVAFYIFIIYISVMLAKKFGKKQQFLTNIVIAPPLYMYELGKDGSYYTGKYNTKKDN